MNDIFAGYACIFNQVDLGNDIILPSAFEKCLAQKQPNDISLLWQHDPNQPIGKWLELKADAKGLYVVGRLSVKTAQAHDVAIMIEDEVIDGLSIGFNTRNATQKSRDQTRLIHDLDLWEISIVTFPMQVKARIAKPQNPAKPNPALADKLGMVANIMRA